MSDRPLTDELWVVLNELDPATGKTKLQLIAEKVAEAAKNGDRSAGSSPKLGRSRGATFR